MAESGIAVATQPFLVNVIKFYDVFRIGSRHFDQFWTYVYRIAGEFVITVATLIVYVPW